MAVILGPRALINIAVPTGVDAGEVLRFSLKDGSSAEQVVAQAAALIGAKNEELFARYGGMLSLTEEIWKRMRQGEGARSSTPIKSEFSRSDAVQSLQLGQMWPILDYMDALGWTPEYLRDAYVAQLMDDLDLILERWENRVDFDILTRAITDTETAIATNGYDVPWAIGTGDNVNFTPPQFRGKVFTTSHTHFDFNDSDTNTYDVLLDAMSDDLREHGFSGRLQCLVSDADIVTVKALANFVLSVPIDVSTPGGSTSTKIFTREGEPEGIPGTFFGLFVARRGIVELFLHERIPTGYAFMTRSFGVGNVNNGLIIRVHPRGNLASGGTGFGLSVDPQVNNSIVPQMSSIDFHATHGVGVGQRLNGVAGYRASGISSWANPTIS